MSTEEIASLRRQLMQLRSNLLKIEDQEVEYVDPRSVPPDLTEAKTKTLTKIKEVETRLAELEPDRSQREHITIPFVVVAMTPQEASDLLTETVFDDPEVAPAQRTRLQEFKRTFAEDEIQNWLAHYAEEREGWAPHTCSESTIRDIVQDVADAINHSRELSALPPILPQFCSADFFSGDEALQEEAWQQLARSGCVLIVDAVSLFHPRLHQMLSDSQMGSKDQVAMLVLSPVNPCANEAAQLLEGELRSRMRRAFARFDKHLDKLCEVGVGDLRSLKRWLHAVLPEAAAVVQKQRPSPSNRELVREQVGQPLGIDRLIFGQRGGQ